MIPREWVCAACDATFTGYGLLDQHFQEMADAPELGDRLDHWPPYPYIPRTWRQKKEEAML